MRTLFLFIVSFYLISSVDVIYSQSTRNYEVLKYDLYVDWTDILLSNRNEIEKRKWNGTMKIKLVSLVNNLVEIELDAVKLKINKVYLNSALLPLDTFTTDKLLTISSNGFHLGDTIQLDIYYTYNNLYNKGFSYRNSKDIFSNNWKFDIDAPSIGTLNEPEDARYWFPCNDVPNDKALVTITADVPIGMKAASVGSLDSTRVLYYEEIEGENNEIICVERFYWSSKHPMPPYLITIAAADYEFNIEKIAINSTTTDSIDVYYYTFPGDWAGENDCNAKRNLSTTQKIMQIYSDLFGDYPFEKYGYATADYTYLGYQSLGMEHQTLTTSSRYWVKDFIPIPRFSSFAHELAHHWFGNMVTCKSWNDVWFNEGGATWLEAIYMERINDDININAYYEFMKNCRYSYLRDNDDLYDIPIGKLIGTDALFRYSVLTYSKASWIYHHLRMLLGNDIFPLFRKLLEQYKFSNISSEEFVNFFIENIPNPPHNIDIKKFIEQFIIYGGHPKYAINTDIKPENDSFLINLNLIQTQIKSETIIDNYLMYLKIDFLDSNNNLIKSEYVVNSENQQNYNFKLEKKPAKIILDTTAALLEVVENNITSIKDNINTINVFPNPSFSNNEITIISNITNIKNIAITDLQGNILIDSNLETNLKIKKYSNNKYIISIPQIKTGTYFILLNGNNVCKLIIN